MVRIRKEDREHVLEQTWRRLLEAAAEEFANSGYDAANINRISLAAGYAKGTIYNYFPSKRALLLALLEYTADLHLTFIAEQVRVEADPARRLECFYQAGFEFVGQYLPQSRVVFNCINGPDDELKAYLFRIYQPMFALVAQDILVPGIAQGIMRPVDPASMSLLLMTIYLGTGAQVNQQGEHFLRADQVAELVLNGLRA